MSPQTSTLLGPHPVGGMFSEHLEYADEAEAADGGWFAIEDVERPMADMRRRADSSRRGSRTIPTGFDAPGGSGAPDFRPLRGA
ncbi:hypothetical protein [Streptomyces sp. NBC_00059]|uniref:hypothetical protein n=1 Tax=Streptomyces sp. NBC_00059 TaxID=2975635 RepID=UPI002251F36B|nr:hypothetical protein [Streptomyces sp. NBC_00059]MCX5412775.1 hypothetical protein [Streptomyces sp. NBC_00059]